MTGACSQARPAAIGRLTGAAREILMAAFRSAFSVCPRLPTTKRGLTFAVGFLAMSADATPPRGVGRVNDVEQHTGKRGLIGKELTQLSKSPRALPGTLRVSNRAFRTCSELISYFNLVNKHESFSRFDG